jgi:nucleotide-binding universal stress UspA family protein
MFNNILVPLDCSKYAESSLKVAIEIAKKFNSSISLIHVVSSREEYCRAGITGKVRVKCDVIQVNEEDIPKICNDLLDRSKKNVTAEGINVYTILKQGKVVEEILDTIKKGKFDLVVMGSRGQSTLKKIFLGSVSSGVIEKAICPVLLTRN